jgi:RNA polymerase sigma-70 factor (ECF subfamily)
MSRETFVALLVPNLQAVRRLVQRRLRTSDQTEDIVQQALLRAFVHRGQLSTPSKFKSWLFSIALNEARMFLRTSRSSVSLDEFPDFELMDRSPSPFAECEQMDRVARLRTGMARLSERDRTAIRLVDIDGLSAAEAAGTLAVSKAAFKSTHFRARQRLGQELRRVA